MKKMLLLGGFLFFLSIPLLMRSQTNQQPSFLTEYQKAVESKTSIIKADPQLLQEATENGWFQQIEAGLQNAKNSAVSHNGNNGFPDVSGLCETADPFCTSVGSTYPAGVNTGTAQSGPNYGCLGSQPNPAWYYMKILTGGDLHITETNSANVDIDFILWGPFPNQNCCGLLTAGKIVDCSFSSAATEYIDIASCSAGEFYMLLVTNFSNSPTQITLAQTGGSASTDCSIINPPPPSPVAGGASGVTSTSFSANWGSSSNATGYYLDVALDPGFTNYLPGFNNKNVGNVLTFTVTGLAPGTSYYYRVRAFNVNGTSSSSNTIVVTLPATISGSTGQCVNTTNIPYSSQTGMSSYVWTVSSGGTITGGQGTSAVTISWTSSGTKTISVSYTNTTGNTATGSYSVTVHPLPVPTLSGTNVLCQGTTGNVYTTQSGMSNYSWTVSAGGVITAGGTSTSNTVTIKWVAAGAQSVSVNYTNANGCVAATATQYAVTVNPTPEPTINIWNNYPCVGANGNQFYTESGMGNYVWSVTSGGVITAGQGTLDISVTWIGSGMQTISVDYVSPLGCPSNEPGIYMTVVNALPASPGTILGSSAVCAGEQGIAYSVSPVPNTSSYNWYLPTGATIASGAGTNSVTVNFGANSISGTISVAGVNECGEGALSNPFALTVNPLPGEAGTISGTTSACQGYEDVSYSVTAIPHATGYHWTVPAGATIVSGSNTNHITVDFGPSAVTGTISVYGSNACGDGQPSTSFTVTVNPKPSAPVITENGNILSSSATSGNQWYLNGSPIAGATGQTLEVMASGDYYATVTVNGCESDPSNIIMIVMPGINEPVGIQFTVYPVPNDGVFTVSCQLMEETRVNLSVYNHLGIQVYETDLTPHLGMIEHQIDLRPVSSGVYIILLKSSDARVIRKILVNR